MKKEATLSNYFVIYQPGLYNTLTLKTVWVESIFLINFVFDMKSELEMSKSKV